MAEPINERVDVLTIYRKHGGTVLPYKIKWNGRYYTTTKLGYHHKVKEGTIVFHVFSILAGKTYLRLKHDPTNLHWILEEVEDGFSSESQ